MHFMNNQTPQFELKIFFAVLLKKKKVTYIFGWPEGQEINSAFSFLGELTLSFATVLTGGSTISLANQPASENNS